VSSQVHAVVQNPYYFDVAPGFHAIEQQVASASSVSSNMERIKAFSNLVAFSGSYHIRSDGKLVNGLYDGCSIVPGLSGTEIFGCPVQNAEEITLCLRAEAYAPTPRGHAVYLAAFAMTGSEILLM
jgi:hypothetical protein